MVVNERVISRAVVLASAGFASGHGLCCGDFLRIPQQGPLAYDLDGLSGREGFDLCEVGTVTLSLAAESCGGPRERAGCCPVAGVSTC